MMTVSVMDWWRLLCLIAALNGMLWLGSAWLLWRGHAGQYPAERRLRLALLLLSAGYVLGCGFRSLFPVFDVPRLVIVDSSLSTVAIGRSVATLAELCFAAQWALLLTHAGRITESRVAQRVAAALVPMIVLAEACSWAAVLSTSNLGHVFEESLWGTAAVLVVAALLAMAPRCDAATRRLFALLGAAGAGYALYMFAVDVPMYGARWLADEHSGRAYLGLWQGLEAVAQPAAVSHLWTDWGSEVAWMTLYFSVAVWISIALVHARLPRVDARPGGPVLRSRRLAGLRTNLPPAA